MVIITLTFFISGVLGCLVAIIVAKIYNCNCNHFICEYTPILNRTKIFYRFKYKFGKFYI